MKNVLLFFFVILTSVSFSQISAITQDGKKVLLYPDHTWRYSDGEVSVPAEGISRLEVDSTGRVWICFSHAGKTMIICDGKVVSNDFQSVEIKYNDRFDGFEGKVKSVSTEGQSVSFTYNDAIDKNEGKVKTIQCGDQKFTITYYDIFDGTYAPKGRVKAISSGSGAVQFKYNDRFDGSEGKLKSITGSIPGVLIKYLN